LLRLPAEQQALGAETAVIKAFNVEQTEKLVDDMLEDMQKTPKTDGKTAKSPKRDTVYIKDVRIFLNTLARAVKTMEMSGVRVKVDRFIEREDTVVTVRIGAGKR